MSVKSEIEKIRKQQATLGVRESAQRKKDDLERERSRNQLDQQRKQLHKLAEDSGLLPSIRETASELGWKKDTLAAEYEYSDKYPYNPTALKISIVPRIDHNSGYAEFRIQTNGNIWSHLDDTLPLIKLGWKIDSSAVEKLVTRAFLNPAHSKPHIDQSG
jgi:hypothetical protein